MKLLDNRTHNELNVGFGFELFNKLCFAREEIKILNNVNLFTAFGKKNSFLQSGVTASEYGYFLDHIVLNAAEIQAGEADPDTLGIEAVDDKTVKITAKAGTGGRLFGSVTSKDIAAELKKQLEGKKPELKREDFPSESAWNEYRKEELKKEIQADNEKRQAAAEEASRRNAAAQKKMDDTFRTPEAKRELQETLSDFIEDNGDWLESEEGQLYQEIIDQSPVGLVMAMAIAKNSEVTAQMKNWSKDLLFQKLSQFESTLLQNAKEAAKKQPSNGQTQTPTQTRPSTSGIPSTGSVGKTQAPATFNAKDWLRKNRPERYPTH